jgi:NAD(P)-dependent dehydrogenase (short-subunit alcohol dehydrogenase family)
MRGVCPVVGVHAERGAVASTDHDHGTRQRGAIVPWTATDMPDLAGTTAIVTGPTSGVGEASAIALAARHAHVVLAARDHAKAAALIERISGRFSCAKCGIGYHEKFKLPRTVGVCDACGSREFSRRADDNAEALKKRVEVYRDQTEPLIAYYEKKGLLRRVDGMAGIDEVSAKIAQVLVRDAGRVASAGRA